MISLSPVIVLATVVGLTSAVRWDVFFFRPDNESFKAEFEDGRLKFEASYEKLGPIHIDFEKHRGMWELSKIWECR